MNDKKIIGKLFFVLIVIILMSSNAVSVDRGKKGSSASSSSELQFKYTEGNIKTKIFQVDYFEYTMGGELYTLVVARYNFQKGGGTITRLSTFNGDYDTNKKEIFDKAYATHDNRIPFNDQLHEQIEEDIDKEYDGVSGILERNDAVQSIAVPQPTQSSGSGWTQEESTISVDDNFEVVNRALQKTKKYTQLNKDGLTKTGLEVNPDSEYYTLKEEEGGGWKVIEVRRRGEKSEFVVHVPPSTDFSPSTISPARQVSGSQYVPAQAVQTEYYPETLTGEGGKQWMARRNEEDGTVMLTEEGEPMYYYYYYDSNNIVHGVLKGSTLEITEKIGAAAKEGSSFDVESVGVTKTEGQIEGKVHVADEILPSLPPGRSAAELAKSWDETLTKVMDELEKKGYGEKKSTSSDGVVHGELTEQDLLNLGITPVKDIFGDTIGYNYNNKHFQYEDEVLEEVAKDLSLEAEASVGGLTSDSPSAYEKESRKETGLGDGGGDGYLPKTATLETIEDLLDETGSLSRGEELAQDEDVSPEALAETIGISDPSTAADEAKLAAEEARERAMASQKDSKVPGTEDIYVRDGKVVEDGFWGDKKLVVNPETGKLEVEGFFSNRELTPDEVNSLKGVRRSSNAVDILLTYQEQINAYLITTEGGDKFSVSYNDGEKRSEVLFKGKNDEKHGRYYKEEGKIMKVIDWWPDREATEKEMEGLNNALAELEAKKSLTGELSARLLDKAVEIQAKVPTPTPTTTPTVGSTVNVEGDERIVTIDGKKAQNIGYNWKGIKYRLEDGTELIISNDGKVISSTPPVVAPTSATTPEEKITSTGGLRRYDAQEIGDEGSIGREGGLTSSLPQMYLGQGYTLDKVYSGGVTTYKKSDGTYLYIYPDGSQRIVKPSGVIEDSPAVSVIPKTEQSSPPVGTYPIGTVGSWYDPADGKIHSSDGATRDPEGGEVEWIESTFSKIATTPEEKITSTGGLRRYDAQEIGDEGSIGREGGLTSSLPQMYLGQGYTLDKVYSGGVTTYKKSDGTYLYIYPDGSQRIVKPSGVIEDSPAVSVIPKTEQSSPPVVATRDSQGKQQVWTGNEWVDVQENWMTDTGDSTGEGTGKEGPEEEKKRKAAEEKQRKEEKAKADKAAAEIERAFLQKKLDDTGLTQIMKSAQDAKRLRAAIDGWGTDEEALFKTVEGMTQEGWESLDEELKQDIMDDLNDKEQAKLKGIIGGLPSEDNLPSGMGEARTKNIALQKAIAGGDKEEIEAARKAFLDEIAKDPETAAAFYQSAANINTWEKDDGFFYDTYTDPVTGEEYTGWTALSDAREAAEKHAVKSEEMNLLAQKREAGEEEVLKPEEVKKAKETATTKILDQQYKQLLNQQAYALTSELLNTLLGEFAYGKVQDWCKEEWDASEPNSKTPVDTPPGPGTTNNSDCPHNLTTFSAQGLKTNISTGYKYDVSWTIRACKEEIKYNIYLANSKTDREALGLQTTLKKGKVNGETKQFSLSKEYQSTCFMVSDTSVGDKGWGCFDFVETGQKNWTGNSTG